MGAPPAGSRPRRTCSGGRLDRVAQRYHRLIRPADAEVLSRPPRSATWRWALLELAETDRAPAGDPISDVLVQTLFPLVVVMLGMVVFFMAWLISFRWCS